MSAARSIILLGLPGIAIVLGILWYRKRNPLISDPGGSKKLVKPKRQHTATTKQVETKPLETIVEVQSETEKLSKSLPIDIPVGSPVELTDDQLELEILKIQSQKSQEKEGVFNRSFGKPIEIQKKIVKKFNTMTELTPKMSEDQVVENTEISDLSEEESLLNKSTQEIILDNSITDSTSEISDIRDIANIKIVNSQEKENVVNISLSKSTQETTVEETTESTPNMCDTPDTQNSDTHNSDTNLSTQDVIDHDEACILDNSDHSAAGEDAQKESEIERCDWSEELCDLECHATTVGAAEHVRDSAYHSPTENMSSSPQLSAFSDRHSEHSVDSGKGSSPRSELASTFEFVLPQHVVGRLIGRNGAFVHRIKGLTGANILVKKHPESNRLKICAVEGLQTEIDAALVMIRSKFPEKKFPNITLQRVSIPPAGPVTPELSPECVSLMLVEGVNNDCTVSSVHSAGSVSLHQPLHPSFQSLNLLQCCMAQTYAGADNPMVPTPIQTSIVCACPLDGGWFRAQVINVMDSTRDSDGSPDDTQVLLRLMDYGEQIVVEASKLRQIRADLMMLPFQAVDCLLANVQPCNGATDWPEEATECLRSLTFGRLLQAQIYGFLDDIPLVHLYCCISSNQVIFINQELVARGHAEWVVDAEA